MPCLGGGTPAERVCVLESEGVPTFHDKGHEGDDWAGQFALVRSEDLLVARWVSDSIE